MKETLRRYFKENLLFWSGMLLTVFIGCLFLWENGQINAYYMLNEYHNQYLDIFFKYFTYIGGGMSTYVGLVLMIFYFRKGIFILISQGVAAIMTQPLKYTFAHPRPLTLLGLENIAYPVDGFSIPGGCNSFPSGHTSATFAFMACLAAILPAKYKWAQVLFLIIGITVAYSRVYLSCHFLEDTLSGAVVGASATAITYMLLYYKEWGENPIYKLRQG